MRTACHVAPGGKRLQIKGLGRASPAAAAAGGKNDRARAASLAGSLPAVNVAGGMVAAAFEVGTHMKVTGTPLAQSPLRRRTDRSGDAAAGSFASELGSDGSARAPAAVGPLGRVEMLLAVQEVANEGGGRRRARQRGEAILDQLDALRHGLLTGRIAQGDLSRLLALVRGQRESVMDPMLDEVLAEIELRACVELAKLGQPV